jgi:hypothetical protein
MAWMSFEDRMVAHLAEFFPEKSKALGEADTRERIQEGAVKARRYGIVSEQDVCIYIDMMFEYGNDFDVDPELPWATQVLKDPEIKDSTYKVNRLFDAAMDDRRSGAKAHE